MSPHAKKISLFLSILLLLVSCTVFFLMYRQIGKNSAAAGAAETAWQTETNQREEINSLDATLASVEDEKAELETHFAGSKDIVPFLDTVEKLGTAAHADAEVSSVDILKDNAGLLVSIKAAGTFQSTYAFLRLLENSPYELEFMSTDFQKDAGSTDADGTIVSSGWTAVFKVKLVSFIP